MGFSTYPLHSKVRKRSAIQVFKNRVGDIGRADILQFLVVFAAYVGAGKLGQATSNIRSSNLGPVWPAYGIALAAILLCGYRAWLGVAAGAFFVAFFSPVSHVAAVGQAVGPAAAATAGAFLLDRIAHFHTSLSRLSDAIGLIALGGFGSAIVSASIGEFALYATHVHAYSGLGEAWLIYWLGDATGVLLVTPLVLRLRDFLKLRDWKRIAELGILLFLLAATCLLIFGDLPIVPVNLDVMAFAVLPLIIWAAIRFGLGVTAFSILMVAAIATIETALGYGPFASHTTFVNAVLLDVFFGVLSVSGLSLAAVIAERVHAEREREQVVSKQAAMEARLKATDALCESEERLRLATQAGKMYAYTWDVAADTVVRSDESINILGAIDEQASTTLSRQQLLARIYPDDRAKFIAAEDLTPENSTSHITYRFLRGDGSVIWLEKHGRAFFDPQGRMLRIIGMVADITERKWTEDRLREYEKTVEDLEEMIAVVDQDYRYLIANRQFLKMRNMTREQVVGHFVHELMNNEVFDAVVKPNLDECFRGNVVRYEMKYTYPELGERDLLVSYFPIEGVSGVDRAACIFMDITDRKAVENALASMGGKLIEAQEEESARIARELHDDINQRVTLLALGLEDMKERLPTPVAQLEAEIAKLHRQTIDLANDVQALSHRLHSSKLALLGLTAAAGSFCREFSDRQKVEIDFQFSNVPENLPSDISVCLYRVLQEALQNAVKHSGSRQLRVVLTGDLEGVELTVRDTGIGFDPKEVAKKHGVGLISMKERLKLVGGQLSIESQPHAGTTIRACVPLKPMTKSAGAGESS